MEWRSCRCELCRGEVGYGQAVESGSGPVVHAWAGRVAAVVVWNGAARRSKASPGVPVTDDREERFWFGECFSRLLHNRGVSPRI